MPQLAPCLWFHHQVDEACEYYIDILDATLLSKQPLSPEGVLASGLPEGTTMSAELLVQDQHLLLLNGGEDIAPTMATSLTLYCIDQEDIDRFYDGFAKEGTPYPCGWVQDRYGFYWQVIPDILPWLLESPKATAALFTMHKIDLHTLETLRTQEEM